MQYQLEDKVKEWIELSEHVFILKKKKVYKKISKNYVET